MYSFVSQFRTFTDVQNHFHNGLSNMKTAFATSVSAGAPSRCPVGFPQGFPDSYSSTNLLKVGVSAAFGIGTVALLYRYGFTKPFFKQMIDMNLGITAGMAGYCYYKQYYMNKWITDTLSDENLKLILYGYQTGESTADLNLPQPTHYYTVFPSGSASEFVRKNYTKDLLMTSLLTGVLWMVPFANQEYFMSMPDAVVEEKMKMLPIDTKLEINKLKSVYDMTTER